jgi:peroxiredoxin
MKQIALLLSFVLVTAFAFAQATPEGMFLNSKAKDFKGTDQNGNSVRLKDLLKKGPVVLVFYRGNWSIHCTRHLKQLQDSLDAFTAKKTTVIAVSPELPENIAKTVEKTGASFPVLYDEELKISKAYDVNYAVPQNTITQFKRTNIDLDEINGKNGFNLPITATYIIDKEGTVVYRFFQNDYKKRPTITELLAKLK